MKKLLIVLFVSVFLIGPVHAETKKFCHTYVQKGKKVNVCKTIKIHNKHNGKPVPEKRK